MENDDLEEDDFDEYDVETRLRRFYRNPVMEVLEIMPMKLSVDIKTPCMAYSHHYNAPLSYFHGTACMLTTVEPAESRHPTKF